MKKLAIFDLDGTLLDTIEDLGTAVNHSLQKNGFATHPITAYRTMVGNGVRRLIERGAPADLIADSVDKLLDDFREYYDSHLHNFTKPYVGIVELIDELRRRDIALAVASNKYESATVRLVEHFFGKNTFVSVCGQTDGVPVKPDPSIVFRILSEHLTPKADVIYIGDSAVDIETARRAGVTAVGVSWGFRPISELKSAYADHIITSPSDLLDLL